MFWQLTIRAAVGVTALSAALLALAQPPAARRGSPTTGMAFHSVHWDRIPLGDAVARLRRSANLDILLDRRVDPNQRVTLSLDRAAADEILAHLADASSLGHCRLGPLAYLGPPHVAERLPTLVAQRRRDVGQLSEGSRRSLAARKSVAWPRLSIPRDLIVQLANEHGWGVEHAERIPHDLWPAGRLPSLPIADQFTLLLAGFDLTYRLHPERNSLEVVPVAWESVEPTVKPAPRRRPKPIGETREVYTLRVAEQPVGLVLSQLAQRLNWKLAVDDAALRAAGRSLDQRVSFAVENADIDQLLEALLKPAGLLAERDGDRVRIRVKRNDPAPTTQHQ